MNSWNSNIVENLSVPFSLGILDSVLFMNRRHQKNVFSGHDLQSSLPWRVP